VKLGEVYAAPWGRYVVHSEAPLVLRSLDRAAAFIRDPSARDYQLVGSDPGPRMTDPQNGQCERGGDGARRRGEGPGDGERRDLSTKPPGNRASETHHPSPHDGPWRPGVNALRAHGLPAWRPCLTRARGEAGEVLAGEHVWFLQDDGSGSLYCPTCRASQPRAVMGPKPWIARIRAALKAGDIAAAHELVRLGPNSAPVDHSKPDPLVQAGRAFVAASNNAAAALAGMTVELAHRDIKPVNVQHVFTAEITIVCESVKPGCEFRALFYDRATGQHYGGSAHTALEALAWAMDDYIARAVHGMPWMAARKPSDTPGSRFAAAETRKAAA
jgi:hypothetical protein